MAWSMEFPFGVPVKPGSPLSPGSDARCQCVANVGEPSFPRLFKVIPRHKWSMPCPLLNTAIAYEEVNRCTHDDTCDNETST